jgi:hypothetical protein
MRKRELMALAGIIIIHDVATLYSLGHLWGLSLMHPSDVNPIAGRVWETVFYVLSLPLLRIFSSTGTFSIFQMYLLSTMNSIFAGCLGYGLYLMSKKI